MPSLRDDLLQFNPTTIEDVRKEYNLDKPGAMEQAIGILQEWIQKQEHFVKKDFCREYLERIIISTKGSVERAKVRMDKICTMRTTVPELFTKFNIKAELSPSLTDAYVNVYMPKLTEDNYRPYITLFKRNGSPSILLDGYRHNMILAEYLKRHDYATGVVMILDIRDCDIVNLVSQINFVDMHNAATVYTEGFGLRIKNIFIISSSKVVDLFSGFIKGIFSAKVGQRVIVLKTAEDLHNHLPKELLPEDFGGEQKSIMELYDKWTEELSSEEHVAYVKEMAQACTNEALRRSDHPNAEYLGIAGSFKVLNVD